MYAPFSISSRDRGKILSSQESRLPARLRSRRTSIDCARWDVNISCRGVFRCVTQECLSPCVSLCGTFNCFSLCCDAVHSASVAGPVSALRR